MPRLGLGIGLGEVAGRIALGRGFRVGLFFARANTSLPADIYSSTGISTGLLDKTSPSPATYINENALVNGVDYNIVNGEIYFTDTGSALTGISYFGLGNNTTITTLDFTPLSGIESNDLESNGLGIYLFSNTQLRELTLPNVINGDITILSNTSLSTIRMNVEYYPNFVWSVNMVGNSSYIDNSVNNFKDKIFRSYFFSNAVPSTSRRINIPGNRTVASDDYFLKVYKIHNFTIQQTQLDGINPSLSSPTEYVPCTPECSAYTVLAPVSSVLGRGVFTYDINRQTTDRVAWHRGLTAEFIKTGNIVNSRDVFSNSSDFHLIFNRQLSGWTIVGPTSSSNTIWLSAQEGVEYWGNPPSIGWTGRAYSVPGWSYNPAQYGTVWFQETTVLPSSQMLFRDRSFSGEFGGTQLRMYLNPLSGYNPSFYRPELDFTGIVFAPGGPPIASAKGYLVSPLHYVTNTHFPVPGNPGASVSLYARDGTILTRTVLSSVAVGNDITVGILNTPITGVTFYQVGSGAVIGNSFTDRKQFANLLYGPTQDGKVGNVMADSILKNGNSTITRLTLNYSFWPTTYTIPKMNWYGTRLVGGDSTSAMWYTLEGRLILLGTSQSSNTSGPCFGDQTNSTNINRAMTNLSNRFSLAVHTLSAYNF